MRWKHLILALVLGCHRETPAGSVDAGDALVSESSDIAPRDVLEPGLVRDDAAEEGLDRNDGPEPDPIAEDAFEPDSGTDAILDAGESDLGSSMDAVLDAERSEELGEPPPPVCGKVAPWSRKVRRTGGAVTINEVMYNRGPASMDQWIELYNPLAIEVDLSRWHLEGDVQFTFPEGTVIAGRSYVVVAADIGAHPNALGPFAGALRPDGVVEVYNNAGRLMDSVHYSASEPWPATPDGSGASLAKVHPHRASEEAESWTGSREVGGTPGAPNFSGAGPTVSVVFPEQTEWKIGPPGSAAASWTAVDFDHSGWDAGTGPFYSLAEQGPVPIVAHLTADNFFALYVGQKDGHDLRLIGRDSVTDWTSPEQLTFEAAPNEHVFVAAWEDVVGDQGPQMWIGEFERPDGSVLRTARSTFAWTLGPDGAAPGGSLLDPAPEPAQVQQVIEAGAFEAPGVEADRMASPWGWAVGSAFHDGTRYLWADTFDSLSVTNAHTTYALFRSNEPVYPAPEGTLLPQGFLTYYFRKPFDAAGYPAETRFYLSVRAADGAVVYLDGNEVVRIGMPGGEVLADTPALEPTPEPLVRSGVNLGEISAGPHLLSAEVHASGPTDPTVFFSATLLALHGPLNEPHGLVLNEVGGAGAEFFVEVKNASDAPVETTGWSLSSSAGWLETLPSGVLAPGGLLILNGLSAEAGDKIFLYPPDRTTVADGVEVRPEPRGRLGDRWLYPIHPTPAAENQFQLHDEIAINEIMYHAGPIEQDDGTLLPSPEEWVELYNRGPDAVDLSGWQLQDATEFVFPEGTILPPGGYLVVARDWKAMKEAHPDIAVIGNLGRRLSNDGARLRLTDACGNPADEVRYFGKGRWPSVADGGRSSLELRDPRADNSAPEAWAPSDEARFSGWQVISYVGTAAPSPVGPDGQWQEFVMGLLDEGVVLVDDVSVLEDPDGAAKELIQNGTFDDGTASKWRLLGNHRHSQVIPDPDDPSNPVLMLRATGPTEHMHNHAETTLANGAQITNGRTYRISFRARWVSGSNQLHTRLYFNRLARTTRLAVPSPNGTPGRPNSMAVGNIGPTFDRFVHAPVVPPAFVPVSVAIQASDPDGVAWVRLWWRPDGGDWASLEMEPDIGGGFIAFVPGQPAGTRVQLYVEAADRLGAVSTWPALGPESRVLYAVEDGREKNGALHDLRILMLKADADWLFAPVNVMSNDHLGATVVEDESEVYPDVGIRLKGSERGRPVAERVGFAISFDPARPFRGVLDSILVDRSAGVQFGQREMLIQQVICRAGAEYCKYDDLAHLIAPRVEYDGSAQLQLARFEDIMLDNQFEDGADGDLFEYELIYYPTTTDDNTPEGLKLPQPDLVVGTPIQDLGPDPEAYRFNFIIKSHRWKDDYRRLIEFATAFGKTGPEFESIGDFIDTDEWLRAFAFGNLSGVVDNYATGAQHNAFFYVRPSDRRVLYFLHDLDFYGWTAEAPIVGSADLARLIATPENFRRYYVHLYDIVSSAYNPDYLDRWCEAFKALLPEQDFDAYCAFMTERYTWVTSVAPDAIEKAVPRVAFEITTNGGLDLSVPEEHMLLAGNAWIDVDRIRRAGEDLPLAVTFDTVQTWSVDLPLLCGPNPIALEAVDRAGHMVGSDQITIESTAPGCL